MDKDMVHQEMNMIQGCINRMASNSFMLKGWYVSLVLLGATILSTKDVNPCYPMLLLFILTAVFWWLDGFFLKTETLYRWKYEWVIRERLRGNTNYFYDLNPYNKNMWLNPIQKTEKQGLWNYINSKTLRIMYGPGVLFPILYCIMLIIKSYICK